MERNTSETIVKLYSVWVWVLTVLLLLAGVIVFFMTPFAASVGAQKVNPAEIPFSTDALVQLINGAGMIIATLLILVGLLFGVIAYSLWRYRNWARVALLVILFFNLFSFPIGTIIGGFGIYFFGFRPEVRGLFTKESVSIVKKAPARRKAAKKKK